VLSGGERADSCWPDAPPASQFPSSRRTTSHLDISSRNVLEAALKQFQGTLCLITHDRHLINAIANKVIEIDRGRPHVYPGDYDYYLFKKQQVDLGASRRERRRVRPPFKRDPDPGQKR